MTLLPVFTVLWLYASSAFSHMVLSSPKPFYEASTSPLAKDGSNFPCAQPAGSAIDGTPAETVAAGSTLSMKLAGSACHGGGSCQHSLSYDNGKNWMVIESLMGGCPIQGSTAPGGGQGACQLDFNVPIPEQAPSGKAVFGWSWLNKVGNREFYMGCAIIEITGGGTGFSAPKMFTGNLYGDSDCVTNEGDDFVYPNPGNIVTLGGKWASGTPGPTQYKGTCSVNQEETITVDGSGQVTQGGSGSPLDKNVGVKSDEGSASPGSSGSGSAGLATPSGKPTETTDDDKEDEDDQAEAEEEGDTPTSTQVVYQTNKAGEVKACRPKKKGATAW